jgi:hypothetical protein
MDSTLSKLEGGAVNAAKANGASTLTMTASMVKDSMGRLLRQNGFTQEMKNGQATSQTHSVSAGGHQNEQYMVHLKYESAMLYSPLPMRVVFLIAILFVTICRADTLIGEAPGPAGPCLGSASTADGEYVIQPFTISFTATSVAIMATLPNSAPNAPSGAVTLTAYLLSSAPPTTAGAVLASQALIIPGGAPALPNFVLLGLTLPPGTYYLLLAPSSSLGCSAHQLIWPLSASNSIVSGASVGHAFGSNGSGLNAGFPPGSAFSTDLGGAVTFFVLGDVAPTPTPTPAPATLLLTLAGLSVLVLYQWVRSGAT